MNNRVCRSVAELDRVLQDMAQLIPEMIDDIIRELLESLYIELAGGGSPTTPIRTGRARTGWTVDLRETEWVPPDMAKSPRTAEEVLAAARHAVAALPRATVYYLYNNVPYIMRLERGWSQQAPQGFIAIALANLAAALEKRVQEFAR
jgi:hypothetical protein